MARILSEVFRPVDHKAFAPEEVNAVWYAFRVDLFSCTQFKVLLVLEALTILDAGLKHLPGLLAKLWMLLMIRFEKSFPYCFYCLRHDQGDVVNN